MFCIVILLVYRGKEDDVNNSSNQNSQCAGKEYEVSQTQSRIIVQQPSIFVVDL